jgi:hypothetical protein
MEDLKLIPGIAATRDCYQSTAWWQYPCQMELKTGKFTQIHLKTTGHVNLQEGAPSVLTVSTDRNLSDF